MKIKILSEFEYRGYPIASDTVETKTIFSEADGAPLDEVVIYPKDVIEITQDELSELGRTLMFDTTNNEIVPISENYLEEKFKRQQEQAHVQEKVSRLLLLEQWFSNNDIQESKWRREMRKYGKSDINIVMLDEEAEKNRIELRNLKKELAAFEV